MWHNTRSVSKFDLKMTPHWTGRCRLLISSHSKVSGQLSPGEQKIVMKVQIIIFWKPFLRCDADVTMWPFLKDGNVTDPFGGGGDMAILRVRRIYCIGHRPSSLHCQEHQKSSTSSLNWTILLYLVSNARGLQLPWKYNTQFRRWNAPKDLRPIMPVGYDQVMRVRWRHH